MKPMMMSVWVGLVLIGCATGMSGEQVARSKDPQMVIGKTWQWVSTVTPAGKIALSEGRLSFGPLMSTRMACPPDTQDNEGGGPHAQAHTENSIAGLVREEIKQLKCRWQKADKGAFEESIAYCMPNRHRVMYI